MVTHKPIAARSFSKPFSSINVIYISMAYQVQESDANICILFFLCELQFIISVKSKSLSKSTDGIKSSTDRFRQGML